MKNPDHVPLTQLDSDATLAEVVTAVNKIIQAINSMWDTPAPDSQ